MKESIIDKILCSTGYLPPRDEKEMMAFESVYSKVVIDKNFHVDVESIVYKKCCILPIIHSTGNTATNNEDMRMAARNYESMPKDVIDKIKKQHRSEDDESE